MKSTARVEDAPPSRPNYPPAKITIELSQQSLAVLIELVQTGKFGATVDGAAAEMLRHRLRELEREGWLRR